MHSLVLLILNRLYFLRAISLETSLNSGLLWVTCCEMSIRMKRWLYLLC